MSFSILTPERNSISPDLAAIRESLKREGRRLAAHHRKMLALHWPAQYAKPTRARRTRQSQHDRADASVTTKPVRELSARRIEIESGAVAVETVEQMRWVPDRRRRESK